MAYLLPATADTTAPTIVGYKYPADGYQATPADPVEIELTAFDERGDMKQVGLYADGVYPRDRRSTRSSSATRRRPRPSAATVTLTAEAVDVAGNSRHVVPAASTCSPRRAGVESPVRRSTRRR